MPAKKQTEAADEAVVEPQAEDQPDEAAAEEDQPVPELKHPSAPGYVLRDGQWVADDTEQTEGEGE